MEGIKRNNMLIAILVLLILNIGIVALAGTSKGDVKSLERESSEIDVDIQGEYIAMDPEDITPIPNTNADPAIYHPSAKASDTEVRFY